MRQSLVFLTVQQGNYQKPLSLGNLEQISHERKYIAMLKVKMTVNLCWVKFEDLMMNNEDLRESFEEY